MKQNIELPDRSFSVSDIQDYFDYFTKTYQTTTENPPIRAYVNKIENRITFRINARYSIELLTPDKMKLLGSPKSKITKDGNDEKKPHSEIIEAVSVCCNIANNYYECN